jgi:hypothetical protein
MWKHKQDTDTDPEYHRLDAEPYFESEVLAELGWSLEDKVGDALSIVLCLN